ncbi:MAG: FAD-dependent oxidoreductase, partial [Bacteroidales bacterium]|nr:FAD-dependent oxidoreductase [Bacteroidales bacterium]
ERVSSAAHQRLEELGVVVYTNTQVNEAHADGFVTADGRHIAADLLVWAAGIQAPAVLGTLGLETNRVNQLVVEPTLQARGESHIWVIGDCASFIPSPGARPLPPRAQTAQQMASLLAASFQGMFNGKEALPFRYRDRGSLVSLSKYSSVGSLMGNLKGGQWFIEGWIARTMYISLYRLHQAALYGWPRTLLLLVMGRFNRLVRPRLKLH